MILEFPTWEFASYEFRARGHSQTFRSPLTGNQQTAALPGDAWVATYNLPPLRRAAAALWQVFLASLRGESGRFYGGDPMGITPRGTAAGASPRVNGGAQTGLTLVTDGWDASQGNLLRPGDYVAFDTPFGRELHMIADGAESDGSGNSTLVFARPIRNSPQNNAVLIVSEPTCIMKLVDDEQGAWSVANNKLYGLSFTAEETFFA